MGFGRYRFRRSFGQVKSTFRGARPNFYPLTQSLLSLYPATAAYSAYDLGNKRGSVTEAEGTVINPVQRWRRGSDDALQMFTAKDIADGTALDFVVPTDVQDLYNSAMYFGVSTADRVNIPFSNQFFSGGNTLTVNAVMLDGAGVRYCEAGATGAGTQFRLLRGNFSSGVATVDFRHRFQTSGETLWQSTTSPIQVGVDHEISVTYDSDSTSNDPVITVDGVTMTLTESVAPVGSAPNADTDLILGNSESFNGSLSGVIYNVTVGSSTYVGDGNANSNWIDTSGNGNNGTVNGSPATFTGQGYDAYLLTEYDQHDTGLSALYGSARYFNGTSTEVALNSTVTLVGDFSLSFSCFFDVTSVNQVLMGSGASNMVQLNSANQWRLDIGGTANIIAGTSGTTGVTYDVTVARVGTVVTLTLNGTDSVTDFGNSNNFIIDYIGSRGGSRWVNGSIWDVTIDGSHYTGLGTSVTAWEDTIGSNDGTETSGATFQGQGVAYDLTQTTAANQPLVVSGGVLTVDDYGNTAPLPDGVNDYLESSLIPPSIASIFVLSDAPSGNSEVLYGARDAANERSLLLRDGNGKVGAGVASEFDVSGAIAFNVNTLVTLIYDGITRSLYANGATQSSGAQAQTVDNVTQGYSMFALNNAGTNVSFSDAPIAATLVYDSDQTANRTAIEAKLSTIVTTALS